MVLEQLLPIRVSYHSNRFQSLVDRIRVAHSYHWSSAHDMQQAISLCFRLAKLPRAVNTYFFNPTVYLLQMHYQLPARKVGTVYPS